MTELQTARLVLRPARPDDAPCFALGLGDYEVARWLTPVPWPYSLVMAQEWLRQAPAPTPEKSLFIIDLPGRGLIGCISLAHELGFWVARPHWGRGYVTEAATALLDWHFTGTASEAITCSTHHGNAASLQVQRKLGFKATGRQKRFSQALQHNVDHIVTTLGRHDWLGREHRECA